MNENRKKRLVELGAEALANALLELAIQDDVVEDLVQRLISTPTENIKRFKAKLAAIKRSRRFISWGESGGFARELEALLEDMKAGVEDPRMGAELVVAFYETDSGVLGNCDDSSGNVGDVFRFDAKELFVDYASRCADKKWLADLVFKLNRKDNYGLRDTLIHCASEYLQESDVRALIARIQKSADKERGEYEKRHWLLLIESLARQIKDAPLFEKTRIASWGTISTAALYDIAKVYMESGDARTALSWLEKIDSNDRYKDDDRDRLLLKIYGCLGLKGQQTDVAWRIFRRYRCKDSLDKLLAVIGEENRDAVVAGEVAAILADKSLRTTDADFLVELGFMDEVENYLLNRTDQLNGDFYDSLLPLAQAMENSGRSLAATALYRALLDSILQRAKTPTYAHGVRYLKKLGLLAKSVSDWRGFNDHDTYFHELRQNHGRKSSFWAKYGQ